MITFSRSGIRIGEVYFSQENPPTHGRVDLIRHVSILCGEKKRGLTDSSTLVLDLTKTEDALLKDMDTGTRYEIRRAQSKDGLSYVILNADDSACIETFCDYYDYFAKSKSLPRIFRPRLHALAEQRVLLLTAMSTAEGSILVQHAHIVTPERAMLMYSASIFRESTDSASRSLVARANRLLHWCDMLTARKQGVLLYDMCGVDVTNKTAETTNIAKFKLGFGGVTVPCYTTTKPASLKGRIVQGVLHICGKSF
jgi:hypothetical protein